MSNSSIEGKLRGLQERFENEMRIRREGGTHIQGGPGTPRTGSVRRTRPTPVFSHRDIPVPAPRSPHAAETENRMREVYKVSGKLSVDDVEYRSSVDDLLHLGELGSGTCGHVVKMLHKPSKAVIAVKQMRRSGNSEETKRILMDLDVVVHSHDCPYIVRCLGCFVTDADVWICMELMASCFDKLLKRLRAPIPEPILGKVTVATVNALSYLKDKHGVIHRDVKPSNILLDERGNVKLCDFGISGRLVDSKAKTRSAGCAAYMAPERIDPPDPQRPDYDIRADVWSLGISLVELATGVFPYRDCQNDFEVLTRVIADEPPRLPDEPAFSPQFKSFVSQCLTKNYRQRPKYAKLLEHPFVVRSARSSVSVGAWYATLPAGSPPATPPHPSRGLGNGLDLRGTTEQVTPTPTRPWWAESVSFGAGNSISQPSSLEAELPNNSPHPRRRTLEGGASPPSPARTPPAHAPQPAPARRVSADSRWRASPSSSGNTSPIVLQRFYHQNQQRRSRVDLHAGPRHRSLSREHSAGRSPEPPPRVRRTPLAAPSAPASDLDGACAGALEREPPHERLHPPSPLLLNDKGCASAGRSHSLSRASPRSPLALRSHPDDHSWLHSLAGLVKRRLGGYVKWHHVAGHARRREPLLVPAPTATIGSEREARGDRPPARRWERWEHGQSWSTPSSPLPPRAPPPPLHPAH